MILTFPSKQSVRKDIILTDNTDRLILTDNADRNKIISYDFTVLEYWCTGLLVYRYNGFP